MKILTNIQTSQLGGIGQTLHNLVSSLEKNNSEKVKITGVEVVSEPNCSEKGIYHCSSHRSVLKIVPIRAETPYFGDVIQTVSCVDGIKNTYSGLIDRFASVINREKPSLILINGTYFVPWCLFQAGSRLGVPMVLHYHGILTKETAHYDRKLQKLIKKMEQTFDNDQLLYIFPSKLAKTTVEKEVFGHKISKIAIIPNSIPNHFFNIKTVGSKKNIAFVGRWSRVKNPRFVRNISRYSQKNDSDYCFNIISNTKAARKDMGERVGKVVYYEPMSSRKLAGFFGSMGIVISPSTFETYGNVAQEAIATGTPALVSSNMGVAETFKELGLSHYVVDFKSTKKIYNLISDFSGQPVSDKVKRMFKYNLAPAVINQKLIRALKSV